MREVDASREVQAPHWKCVYCSFRLYDSAVDLAKQICDCGRGKGCWGVINGELIPK